MAKAKARGVKPTSSKSAEIIPTSDAPANKTRRTNAIKLSIPNLDEQSVHTGNLLVCGANDVGQLGFDSDEVQEKTRPVILPDVKDLIDVKAGGMHSLCLVKDGSIWSFGCNDEGALGRDTSKEGSEMTPQKVQLDGKAVKISAGDSHSAALLEDGRVFAWGSFRDSHGSMGLTLDGKKQSPVEVIKDVVAVDIASGNDHLVILAQNGFVFTLGCAEQGQLGRVSARTLTGESRRGNTTMLKPEAIPKKSAQYIANAIWTTPFCTFFRENSSDQIYAFGLNNYNQLGTTSKGKKIKSDAEYTHFPVLSKFRDVKSISGGQHHTLILTNKNKCFAIGRKDYGRLGLGEVAEDLTELQEITALSDKNITQLCCGESNSFVVSEDGKAYVFGMGSAQLGIGDEDDVLEPKLMATKEVKDKNILAVSSGGQHTLLLVEAPASTPPKAKKTEPQPVESSTSVIETQPKENGVTVPVEKPTAGGRGKKKVTPVIMESDSTTDVNGNSEKDEKMETDLNAGDDKDKQMATKRGGRKRKA